MAGVDTDEERMTLGEWINAAGFVLAVYVVIGLFWADLHASRIEAYGIDKPVTYGLHIALWPLLVVVDLDFSVLGMHLHLT